MRTRCLLVVALLGLLAVLSGCQPAVEHLPTPTGVLPGPGAVLTPQPDLTPQPALLEKRQLILEWPRTIREKDSDLIVLTIAMDEAGQATATLQTPGKDPTPFEIPNLYDTHTILAVARLDLAGMEAYRENLREPLQPGQPAVFRWSVRANEAGIYRGVVWLHLELVPRAGGAVTELLLLSRPIEIRAVTLLGLSGSAARLFGGIGLVASTVLGYPFIQRWIEAQRKRRKKANGSQPVDAAEQNDAPPGP